MLVAQFARKYVETLRTAHIYNIQVFSKTRYFVKRKKIIGIDKPTASSSKQSKHKDYYSWSRSYLHKSEIFRD